MTTIKFCRRAAIFNADEHWIAKQAKCSKKTAAEVIANYCGISQTTARQIIEESASVIGTGTTGFSGVGQYGGFAWKTKVAVSFDYIATTDVLALIEKLQGMHPQHPVEWNLRYVK